VTATCPACQADQTDGLLCRDCEIRLRRDLGAVAALWPALEERIGRRDRVGQGRGGCGGPSSPAEPRWDAVAVRDEVKATLVAWARIAVDDLTMGWPDDTGPAIARALASQDWRTHEAVAELCDEIADCASQIHRTVDRPLDKAHLGPCPACRRDVFADPGRTLARCPCGQLVDVRGTIADRRTWADDCLVTQAELGTVIPRQTVSRWIKRGELPSHGTRDGKPAYRLGDTRRLRESI
jgi:hypothetical protein